jgi:Cof subfamily protein (haloacid dehalogenase superfamily)
MSIRLIAMDLDGTLVGPAMQVPQRTCRALQHALLQGCWITIATGRSLPPVARFARELGLNAPLLLCQGALIRDHRDGTVLYRQAIPLEVARRVIQYAQTRELALQAHMDDEPAYADRTNRQTTRMETISGISTRTVDNLAASLEHPPLKLMIYVEPEAIGSLLADLKAEFGDQVQVVQSWHHLLEITHLGACKGQALAWLAGYLGIAQSETMAIGDHDNDISMLSWAGLGVAMSHATPACQAAADVVAPRVPHADPPNGQLRPGGRPYPPHDEGVAWAIERYVLGQEPTLI